TKHIALRYFLARELQQRGQLRLAYVASEANTADIFTKALAPGDHQRFCTLLVCLALLDWSCFPTCTQHSISSFIPVSSHVPPGTGGATRPRPYFVPLLEQVLGLPLSPGPAPPLECPQPVQSQSPLPVHFFPRSPPVLYVDNKAMLALCREHRLEHRTKHIALRYFLARELQQRGQLRLAYVASEANTADIFTKALAPGDHQRFCTMLACFALFDWSCDLLFSPALPMGDVTFDESVCFYRLLPHASHPVPLTSLFLVPVPPPVDPLPPQGPAPSAEGGDPAVDDTAATSRSPRLETPPGFPPRPSLPPLQPVAVDSGAAGIGDTRGEDSRGAGPRGAETGGEGSGGAETSGEGSGGADSGDAGSGGAASPNGGGAVGAPTAGPGGTAGGAGAAGAGGPGAAGARGAAGAGGTGAGGTGGAGAGAAGSGGARATGAGGAGAGGAGAEATGAGGTGGARGVGAAGTGGARAGGVVGTSARGAGVADGTGTAPRRPFFYPQPQSSVPPHDLALRKLPPGSPLPAPSPYTDLLDSLTSHLEPESRASTIVCTCCVARSRPPAILGTHVMALCPSSIPHCIALPSPPASSLPGVPDPESDLARAASPTVTHLLATFVTDPSFESTVAFAPVTKLFDFAATHHLDHVTSLVTESESVYPPSVGGEPALGCDVLEDKQFELECLAAALPRFASMLFCPEGDPDALDIPTARSYAEAIPGAYVDKVPPPGASIVDGMWIFRVKRPPGSPPPFKGSLYEEIWLRRPPGFTGLFPEGTQWSLRRAVYGLRQAPRDPEDDTCGSWVCSFYCGPVAVSTHQHFSPAAVLHSRVLQCFGFSWSSPQPTPLPTGHSLSPPPSDEYVEPSGPILARYVAPGRHRKVHWEAVKRVLHASWANDQATQQSSQGYTFSLGSDSVSWRSTRLSSVLGSSCEAEIYAGAMAAHELR
ncbi:unnamed protein product, partial [Closterium sp. NIES-53]